MFGKIVKKFVGSRNDRLIKRLQKDVEQINAFESGLQSLSDEELANKTEEFRAKLEGGATVEDILPEAFAVVREAGKRALQMRHFDVQLIGGMVLNSGKIAEMRTGEGKTLVATTAVYLNAISGKGVHVITVNDYLARRDSEWMGKLYNFLGLSVGVIVGGLGSAERREAYACDITYGTNNEFGFDYLRDNMAMSMEDKVQRGLHFAIVDEVDSILIDEARTPLIISGPTDENSELYGKINVLIPNLVRQVEEEGEGDFSVDEKSKQVFLTESGHEHVESLMVENGLLDENHSLYDPANISLLHHLNAALRAHAIYQKDVDYIVKDDQIVIVDEFTGRVMPGRRWSEGLHQAIEAKEGVTIQQENQTLASITFQNYFRLYEKLAGMTGTADTEAYEFQQIYSLEVVVIPTNKSLARQDMPDLVFLTQMEKFDAIIKDIEDCIKRKQPVLVGTASIETSEYLSGLLKKKNINHAVLNAKQHDREAMIIEEAGVPGSVTIATNMAGRGTDIVLGGSFDSMLANLENPEDEAAVVALREKWQAQHDQVLEAGGLHIIGTERHESRRIDNQLRGRSGRQGDAGSTRFYLSLEDNLMRIFASERVSAIMQKLGMEDGEAIEHPWVTKAIENAQRKVEGHNFDIRKHLLEYDDVANDQRKVIYEMRNEYMSTEDLSEHVGEMRDEVINSLLNPYIQPGSLDEAWDIEGAVAAIKSTSNEELPLQQWLDEDNTLDEHGLRDKIVSALADSYSAKETLAGSETLRRFEKFVLLKTLDDHWKEHLASMDYLRQSIGLRGYAQKNPKQEYKREAFQMFQTMLGGFQEDVIGVLSKVQVRDPEAVEEAEKQAQEEAAKAANVSYQHAEAESAYGDAPAEAPQAETGEAQPFVREGEKIGRNDPCWCGSGKKFKHCHGKLV